MSTPKPPKFKARKNAPSPSTNTTGTGGMTDAEALGSLQNSNGQTLKQVLKKNFTAEQIVDILADPKQMEKILPMFFAGILSLEKLFMPSAGLNLGAKNTLLGIGKGNAGGYGGHPIEGYLQFAPNNSSLPAPRTPPIDPTYDKTDQNKEKPGRVEIGSSSKFIKIGQQQDSPAQQLEKYKDADRIAKGFIQAIQTQLRKNPNDQQAVAKIVSNFEKIYVNDLKSFFSDTEAGQEILSKITPKK